LFVLLRILALKNGRRFAGPRALQHSEKSHELLRRSDESLWTLE